MKEVDVARKVVEHLKNQGKEVYQEVVLDYHNVADIVVKEPDLLWIIEVKTSLSWGLMAQAHHRKLWAEKVSVAVPKKKRKPKPYRSLRSNTENYIDGLMTREGVGLLYVDEDSGVVKEVVEAGISPALWVTKLRSSLHPAQKDFIEAGAAGGGHWTPFKQTCKEVLAAVKSRPGMSAKELVEAIDHHYASDSSAKVNLLDMGRKGIIPGVEVQKNGNRFFFYPGSTTP